MFSAAPGTSLVAACEQVCAGETLAVRMGYCGKGRKVNYCLPSGSKNDVPSSHFEHGNQGRRMAAQEGAD